MNNNQWDGQEDISRFLEKFNQEIPTQQTDVSDVSVTAAADPSAFARQEEYRASFEKLEAKIQELESKFAISAAQNQAVLQELTQTRRAVESQKSRDAVLLNITSTVAQLKASVENLSHLHQATAYQTSGANFDITTPVAPATANEYSSSYKPDYVRAQAAAQVQAARKETQQAQAALQTERKEKTKILQSWTQDREKQKRELALIQKNATEKTRVISALQQKASQLKAVNVALDREIKRVHQERLEALRKSAEQAKEILFLRDELSAAEERFKSFDFEGRIISVKQEYEQKVTTLETQLHEITNTCMKQVEEIETLRAENIKLHEVAAEKEQLLAQLAEKEKELQALRDEMASLQENNTLQSQNQQAIYAETVRSLETQRDELTVQLQATQNELDAVRGEKDQLEKNFKVLLEKINSNDAVIEELKGKIEILGEQNQQLAAQNQQLSAQNEQLAAQSRQLSARQTQLEQQLQDAKKTPQTPRAPVAVPAAKRVSGSLKPVKPSVQPAAPVQVAQAAKPAPAAAPVAAKTAPIREARVDTPVEITQEAKSNVQTEADLPEIKVAPATVQNDPDLSDGEDFLEKTDNFLGRIKWSIFNEDR